jgi:tetratricopeptide (TPR) repeat protein
LWVIDADQEATTLRWEGTATAPELVALLATVREGGGPAAAEGVVTFLKANQAAARGDAHAAEEGYRAVLLKRSSRERPRAVEALTGLFFSQNAHVSCVETATQELPTLPSGSSRAAVLAMGMGCARELKRDESVRAFLALAEREVLATDGRTIADDRSGLFEEIVESKTLLGDMSGAKASAQTWARFLEGEAARAPTQEARAAFDPHRVSAYLAAGTPALALPMLENSEREFSNDYNPPARLARVYVALGRHDEARRAIERASRLVYGPRALRVFLLAADIARASGTPDAERQALENALERTTSVVLNDSQSRLRAEVARRLTKLSAPSH